MRQPVLTVLLQLWVLLPVELQLSAVHDLPSLQLTALPAWQEPDWQLSFWVQPLLSALQLVPLDLLLHALVDVPAVHCWQLLDGLVVPLP